MEVQLDSSPLVDQLARSIDVVCRISPQPRTRRGQARQKRLDEAVGMARAAIASGEMATVEAALSSLDFLSLELCEE
jgi:hypothetical protein